jgi:hypothetical protein
MIRAIGPIIFSHSSRHLSKVHILQASFLIDPISLNRRIGRRRIPIIQLPCNCQSVGNVAHFHTTWQNMIDEQHHWDRYVDPWILSSSTIVLIYNIFWTMREDNWTKPLGTECWYTMRSLCDKRILDALVQSAQNKWTKLEWCWFTSHTIVDKLYQHLIFVSKWR